MNYIFRNAVLDYANGGNARAIYANIEYMREAYPPQSFHALMNLLSTHDVARSLHVFGYQGEGDAPEQIRQAKQRLRLAVFFQMIFPGAPAIYLWRRGRRHRRRRSLQSGVLSLGRRGGKPDLELLAEFKRLIAMRKANPVLSRGSLSAPLHLDEHVIVLARQYRRHLGHHGDQQRVERRRTVAITCRPAVTAAKFEDALSHATVRSDQRSLTFTVPAESGTVLIGR